MIKAAQSATERFRNSPAPDGRTLLQVNGHELIGGSRYRGFLFNQAQGFLTDLATGQEWYIYVQFGEPGSGELTWSAQPK